MVESGFRNLWFKLRAIAISKYRLEWKMPVIITISTI